MIDFLSLVLPGEGSGWYAAFDGASKRHLFSQSLAELQSNLESIDNAGGTAYYATAAFREPKRLISSVALKRAFYVDVDFKDINDPDPVSVTIASIKAFCKHYKIPAPNYLAFTGGGCHLYWCLETPVDKDTWLRYANGLKRAMMDFGFTADHPITADAARIMRPPGTFNRKYNPPVRVEGMPCGSGKLITLDRLGPLIAGSVLVPAAGQQLVMPAPTHRTYWIESVLQANECPMMRFAMTPEGQTPATMPEGLWADLMATCSQAEDGQRFAHEFSRHDLERYSPDDVDAKLLAWKGQQHPRTCKRFATHGRCGDCPRQTEDGSPIRFGYFSPLASTAGPMEVIYKLLQSKLEDFYSEEDIAVLRQYRPPMRWPAGYGFDPVTFETFSFTTEPDPDNEGRQRRTRVPLWPGVFWIQHKIRTEENQFVYQFVFWPNKDQRPVKKITSVEMYGSPKEVVKLLTAHGFARAGKAPSKTMNYFSEMLNLMTSERDVPMYDSYGWRGHDNSAFYLGNHFISHSESGIEVKPAIESPILEKSRLRPNAKGTLEAWKEAVATYEGHGREPFQLILMTGFASVLMPFTPNKASHVIHFFSDQSGTGKTSVQRAIQSIWADPALLHKGRSTYAAMIDTFSGYGNLPGLVDEITQYRQEDLQMLAFDIAAGSARDRLRRDGQRLAQRRDWKLIGVTSGNNDVVYMIQSAGNVEGELARITSLQAPLHCLDHSMVDTFEQITTNYGHAGREFVKAVMRCGIPQLQAEVRDKRASLVHDFCPSGNDAIQSANRFRLDMLSAILQANEICTAIGLTRYDSIPLYSLAGSLLKQAIEHVGEPTNNVIIDIEAFIDVHAHEIPKYRRDGDDLVFLARIDATLNRHVSQSGNMPFANPRADLFIVLNDPVTRAVPSIATVPALYISQALFPRMKVFPSIRTDPIHSVPDLLADTEYSFEEISETVGGRRTQYYRITLPRAAFSTKYQRSSLTSDASDSSESTQ